jgi:hypothetical protein
MAGGRGEYQLKKNENSKKEETRLASFDLFWRDFIE